MQLERGARLGPYEISSPIGAGGMGEVYKARDTRLDRTVAIKILPSALALDPQFRERFDREARVISQLDHPHICTLYDVGTEQQSARGESIAYLVMQYLDGETLADRLTRGALPLDQALQVALQIADALDRAHRQGVVHRDLKPGNVMLTRSGARLLDFGLAKSHAALFAPQGSLLPTAAPDLTTQGAILGTLQYMAPEQLEGREADARSDIFAFGALLYESVTGRKAFEGNSKASLIASIMTADPPPIATQQPVAPPLLDRLIRRCLAKNPDERWQTAGDLKAALEWVTAGSTATPTPTAAPRTRRPLLAMAATLAAAILGAAGGWFASERQAVAPALPVRFVIPPPEGTTWEGGTLVLSPDGRALVFDAIGADRRRRLWLRRLDSTTSQMLAGTEGGTLPFWSPDSRSIAFSAGQKLKRIDLERGSIETISEVAPGALGGGTWNEDGTIVFAPALAAPLSRVLAAGGTPASLTTLDAAHEETSHIWPHFLPDGRHYLFQLFGRDNSGIYAASLDSAERTRIIAQNAFDLTAVTYAPPGYLLFVTNATLMAMPFHAGTRQPRGEAVRLAAGFGIGGPGRPRFSASENGILAYRTVPSTGSDQLTWFDRSGHVLTQVGKPGAYRTFDMSPDGKTLAFDRDDPSGTSIWLLEVSRGGVTRFAGEPYSVRPRWSPDGERIAFSAVRDTPPNLFLQALGGTEERLLRLPHQAYAEDWSPDGRLLVYTVVGGENRGDLWVLPVADKGEPRVLLDTPFNERDAQVSPDGKWLAYTSNESGRPEVYVTSFPQPGRRIPISTNGGRLPRWKRDDGGELFYLSQGKLMAVQMSYADAPQPGDARELFQLPQGDSFYIASRDGQKFLINTQPTPPPQVPIEVVLNWPTLLEQR